MVRNPAPQAPHGHAGAPQAVPNNADDSSAAHQQASPDKTDPDAANASEDDRFQGDAASVPGVLIDTSSPSTTTAELAANQAGSPLAAPVSGQTSAFRGNHGWPVLVAILMLIAGLAVLGIAGRARRGC
ncbi:hypothetical protein [Actinosynnema mirum]|uniref:hypothetical protein n=1 Tax=Actinosynnema mirum TaxID=40567 RepID=UPI00117F6FD9|nr:hypothetical protein [Actinosynnema mirum]